MPTPIQRSFLWQVISPFCIINNVPCIKITIIYTEKIKHILIYWLISYIYTTNLSRIFRNILYLHIAKNIVSWNAGRHIGFMQIIKRTTSTILLSKWFPCPRNNFQPFNSLKWFAKYLTSGKNIISRKCWAPYWIYANY